MKKRNWFFFALKLFPLVAFCLAVHQRGASNLFTDFSAWMENFSFSMISDILVSVFSAMGATQFPIGVIHYASYLLVVLFVQICYDVVSFLPDFARGAFERWSKL